MDDPPVDIKNLFSFYFQDGNDVGSENDQQKWRSV